MMKKSPRVLVLVDWNPEAIVDAIHTLFSDPDKADEIGRRARQSVLENHTMEIYTKKIFAVIGKNC